MNLQPVLSRGLKIKEYVKQRSLVRASDESGFCIRKIMGVCLCSEFCFYKDGFCLES